MTEKRKSRGGLGGAMLVALFGGVLTVILFQLAYFFELYSILYALLSVAIYLLVRFCYNKKADNIKKACTVGLILTLATIAIFNYLALLMFCVREFSNESLSFSVLIREMWHLPETTVCINAVIFSVIAVIIAFIITKALKERK